MPANPRYPATSPLTLTLSESVQLRVLADALGREPDETALLLHRLGWAALAQFGTESGLRPSLCAYLRDVCENQRRDERAKCER